MKHEDDLRHQPKDYLCSWQAVAVAVVSAVASAAAQKAFADDPPELETATAPNDSNKGVVEAGEETRKRLKRQKMAQGPQRNTGGFNLNTRQPALGSKDGAVTNGGSDGKVA